LLEILHLPWRLFAEPLLLRTVMLVMTLAIDAAFMKQVLICATALLLPEFLASSAHWLMNECYGMTYKWHGQKAQLSLCV